MQEYVETRGLKPTAFLCWETIYTAPWRRGSPPRVGKEGFEDMYPADVFPGPCWAMLGNHDYDEENFHKVAAELSYADAHPGTRWTMPSKWYRVDYPAQDPLVTCLIWTVITTITSLISPRTKRKSSCHGWRAN